MPAAADSKPVSAALEPQAEAALNQLESRVEGVRRRNRGKFLLTGINLSLAVIVFAFLGFSAADILFKLSVGARTFSLLCTLAGVGAVLTYFLVRPWRKLGGRVDAARNVENKFPELEEQLSTALEFGEDPRLIGRTSSPALVGALMQQTARRAQPLNFARTIRWKPALIAGLIAFLLGACMAGYYKASDRLFMKTFARFFNPAADVKAPTLTEIESVSPGRDGQTEWPVESTVPVEVRLIGRTPERVNMSVFVGDEKNERWEDRPMDRGEDGVYRASLHRLLDSTRYKVQAGDAESDEFKIDVYKLPEISEFALRLEYPQYTGKSSETLPPGVGDVRALKGTTVFVELKANTELNAANVKFKSGREQLPGTLNPADPRKATLQFKIDKDDEYQVELFNTKNKPGVSSPYLVKALKDRPPRVTIRTPERDLMVHREQTVNIEIVADDDVGVREIGLYHNLGADEEQKLMIRKLDPPTARTDGKLVWELGNLGLKGGEVIAYYAYAYDNDTSENATGKMARSEIHFLTVYDEQNYNSPNTPNKMPPTPPAVKQLDKMIEAQKKLVKETFAEANQQKDPTAANREADKATALKTADAQKALRLKLEDMLAKVKADMEQAKKDEEDPKQPKPPDGNGPQPPQPPKPPFGDNELKHMEASLEKMGSAEDRLRVPNPNDAVKPATEALRHLSETRRLMLTDKQGDPRFKMAMDKQARKKKQQEEDQQQQDQQNMKDSLTEMPKMMEREKETERELEELQAKKKQNPPPPAGQPQTPDQKKEQDAQRKLQQQAKDDLEKLAKDAEDRARNLEKLSPRNPEVQPAADKMQQAADKLNQAAREMQQPGEKNLQSAKEKAQQSHSDMREAKRDLQQATEKQLRQEMANLQKDTQDLAQRQQDVAQQARDLQQQEKQGQPKDGQQQADKQGEPKDGQQQADKQGQPKDGQQQADKQGQPKDGQQQADKQGQPKDGQQQADSQQGQPKEGQQSRNSGAPREQQMHSMMNAQRDIQAELKDLADQLDHTAQRAEEKNIGGAKDLAKARQQAGEKGAANQAADKTEEALNKDKLDDAQREAAQAAKALEQLAGTVQNAAQNTAAADMKELANAMKKLQGLARDQGDINKELAAKKEPANAASREEQISSGAQDLAKTAENLEALRHAGRDGSTRDKLEEAAQKAHNTAEALKSQDPLGAKSAGDDTEKALNQAMNDVERAMGKMLEEKARDAKNIAKSARESQEQVNAAAREMKEAPAGEKMDPDSEARRADAVPKETQAARDARRLDRALEGLQDLARNANPAAADAAREARDKTEQADLPNAMDDIARGLDKMGEPKPDDSTEPSRPKTPAQAAEKGEAAAQVLRNVDKDLDAYIAEATGSQLDKLKAMELDAREAVKQLEALKQQAGAKDQTGKAGKRENADKSDKAGKPDGSDKAAKPENKGTDKAQTGDKGDKPGKAGKPAESRDQNQARTDFKSPGQPGQPGQGDKPGQDAQNPADSQAQPPSDQPGKKLGENKGDTASENREGKPQNDTTSKKGQVTGDKGEGGNPNSQPSSQKPAEVTKHEDADPNTTEIARREQTIEKLEKELKRLKLKIDRLEPNAPEIANMRDAVAAVQQVKEQIRNQRMNPNGAPSLGGSAGGGPAVQRASQTLDEVTQGLVTRIERLLRAREVKPNEDEDAPKEYRSLVDKYYRALSEDVEEDTNKPAK